jgi:flagellar motor switch protein FliM
VIGHLPVNEQNKTLAQPGGRGRAACAKAAEAGPELALALKRALPFLARKRLTIAPEPARCVSFADLAADDAILYTSAWTEKTSNARGLVFFDEAGLARVLDGVLGGGDATTLPSPKLTSAQNALAARVTASILRAFADALSSRLGLGVEATANKEIDAGVAVVLSLAIEGGGKISVALPLACIRADEPSEAPKVDEGIAAAMLEVDVDVVAELGKVRLSLDAIAKLQVGDVVRLSLPLDERARVSAGGAVLFHGRPTASGEVVAVALERTAS